MKKNIIKASLLITIFTFLSFQLSAQNSKIKQIKVMCRKFESSVLKKSYKKSLKYFDPEYVRMQHDDFLQGRTEQFLSEFLSGNIKGTNTFYSVKLNEIKYIKFKKLESQNNNISIVILEVKLKNGKKIYCDVSVNIESKYKIYFIGGMG